MSIEALLAIEPTFVHKPQHDLESILYIILYICTFVRGASLPLCKLDVMRPSPPISTWFFNDGIRGIGYRKLTHLESHDDYILPYFTPYWSDFAPFVKELIITCFPVKAHLPNNFQYDQALQILKTAYNFVGEPRTVHRIPASKVCGAQCLTPHTRRRASNSLDRDFQNGRRLWS